MTDADLDALEHFCRESKAAGFTHAGHPDTWLALIAEVRKLRADAVELEDVLRNFSLPEDDPEWAIPRTLAERLEIFMVSRGKKDWTAKTALARLAALEPEKP
jgi:hypothetical protein